MDPARSPNSQQAASVVKDKLGFVVPPELVDEYRRSAEVSATKYQNQKRKWEPVREALTRGEGTAGVARVIDKMRKKNQLERAMWKHGVHPSLRCVVWMNVTGSQRKLEANPGQYCRLLEELAKYRKMSDSPLIEQRTKVAFQEIDNDICRTFPSHRFFQDAANLEMLRRVLCAYALRNRDVGYCQSMNYIAGLILLVGVPEEGAFWLLTTIVEELLKDYFLPTIRTLRVDLRVFSELVGELLPAVTRHVAMLVVPWDIVFTKWFMCLFCTSLPSEVALRVWDIFMVEGVMTVLRVSIALIAMHENEILAIRADTSQLYDLLERMASRVYDVDQLLEATNRIDIKTSVLTSLRAHHGMLVDHDIGVQRVVKGIGSLSHLSDCRFSPDELAHLSIHFEFNTSLGHSRGLLALPGFQQLLLRLAPCWREGTFAMDRMFRTLDMDGDNQLSFGELVQGLSCLFRGALQDKLALCFRFFDLNERGAIGPSELRTMLLALWSMLDMSHGMGDAVDGIVSMAFAARAEASDDEKEELSLAQFQEVAQGQLAVILAFNLHTTDSPERSMRTGVEGMVPPSNSWTLKKSKDEAAFDIQVYVVPWVDPNADLGAALWVIRVQLAHVHRWETRRSASNFLALGCLVQQQISNQELPELANPFHYCGTRNLVSALGEAWTDYLSALLAIPKVSSMAAMKLFLNTSAPDGDNQHSAPVLCMLCGVVAATQYCSSCSLTHLCTACLSKMHTVPGANRHTVTALYSESSIEQLQQQSLRPESQTRIRRSNSRLSSKCLEDYVDAKSPQEMTYNGLLDFISKNAFGRLEHNLPAQMVQMCQHGPVSLADLPVMSGHLEREETTLIPLPGQGRKQRWFALTASELMQFKNREVSSLNKPSSSILVRDIKSAQLVPSEAPNCFGVHFKNNDASALFYAHTHALARQWVDVISRMLVASNSESSSMPSEDWGRRPIQNSAAGRNVTGNSPQRWWLPDEAAAECEGCAASFSMIKRRHHCRRCGGIFCDDCSSNMTRLPMYSEPVRVCDDCYRTENYLCLERFLNLPSEDPVDETSPTFLDEAPDVLDVDALPDHEVEYAWDNVTSPKSAGAAAEQGDAHFRTPETSPVEWEIIKQRIEEERQLGLNRKP